MTDNTETNYIELTQRTFKQRYTQHKLSFRSRKYANRTELAKHSHLKTQRQQGKLQDKLVYHLFSKRLQQHFQTMQPLPN